MPKRIILDKTELIKKYFDDGLSQKECAEYFGCSVTAIRSNFDIYRLKPRDNRFHTSKTDFYPTNEMVDVLNGALLGDGSLSFSGHSVNACFAYESTSLQHVENLERYFVDTNIWRKIHTNKRIMTGTNKLFTSYTFKTKVSPFFTDLYNKWYSNKIKHIPFDIKLTPLVLLIWYLDDGCLKNSKTTYQEINFATNSFARKELEEIIIPQLKQFNPVLYPTISRKTGREEWIIRIPEKEKIKEFLNYIGDCPVCDYLHKWKVKERKITDWRMFYEEWENLYKLGMTQKEISDLYNCHITNVRYFLRTRNLIVEKGYKKYYSEWEKEFQNGVSFSEIARKYHCSRNAVQKHIWKIFGKQKK